MYAYLPHSSPAITLPKTGSAPPLSPCLFSLYMLLTIALLSFSRFSLSVKAKNASIREPNI